MLVLLAAFILSAKSQPQTEASLLARIVPMPTGVNGYEDYLLAADTAGRQAWNQFEMWMAFKRSHVGQSRMDTEADPDVPFRPAGIEPEMSELEVRKVANTQLGATLDRIKVGNTKRVWDPRTEYGANVLYPEFASFKMLAKICSNRAEVEFADGRSQQAVEDLLSGIEFSKNLWQSTMISALVGVAIQSIMLAKFNEHLGQLSLSDAQSIDKTCAHILLEPNQLGSIYEHQFQGFLGDMDAIVKNPEELLSDEDSKNFGPALKALGPSERQQLKGLVTESLRTRCDEAYNRISGPEESWIIPEGAHDAEPPTIDKSVSNLALLISNSLMDKDTQRNVTKALARGQIQLRLLQLHAKVLQFHWQNGVWPRKLEEFASAKLETDPFSRQPFHYELKDGGYRIFSTGIPSLGPIELKYKSLASSQGTGDGPAPPR